MDAAFNSAGSPHEYLLGETPHEGLTGKPFNYYSFVFGDPIAT